MQNSVFSISSALGQLIKQIRAESMDQSELALRVGLSRNTISAIENGKPVNSEALFAVLAQLNLLQPITDTVEKQLAQFANQPQKKQRKQRKAKTELSNDF
ncbi:MAG: helix-turn-helix domain-containing protein [Gammaproteobacteria bacterium]|nr:helix-turn-helix domain-containing protein [Gammaproteobacteria bacterium]MBU2057694.1 helix-turn-helix domain-containing protein [Gammaproteobacteria bacterium]MBU2176394.1 helix-turn-helix domain-containing protein [Gammaproteobacteria bacterium]MBU2246691.1 helix-turn-helix domain-containing protein [Gammaproteobacteria bacterium]MBU2345085.1 helix-turn-helix domain-containing protein [Gammaproteobacteria bacterium]